MRERERKSWERGNEEEPDRDGRNSDINYRGRLRILI